MATQEDARREVAKHLIADYAADAHERLKHQQQISVNLVRSLMAVNGGAIVGLLTFLGNSKRFGDEGDLRSAFLCFGVGLCLALLSNFGVWATEGSYRDHSSSLSFSYQDLLEGKKTTYHKEAEREGDRGTKLMGATLVIMFGSLVLFGVGCYFAVNGIFAH